jgi:hypothetical protein
MMASAHVLWYRFLDDPQSDFRHIQPEAFALGFRRFVRRIFDDAVCTLSRCAQPEQPTTVVYERKVPP